MKNFYLKTVNLAGFALKQLRNGSVLIMFLCLTLQNMQAQAPYLAWQQTYGGSNYDDAYSIQQTPYGGYIVAGYTWSNNGDVTENQGGYDAWILKLNANGDLLWQQTYGGSSSEIASSIQQTTDGGYIVAGYTWSNNGDVTENQGSGDAWILKLDANGDILWQQTYGGSSADQAYFIQQTTDGGYIVAGYTTSNNGDVTENQGNSDVWILKLDANGNLLWQQTYGGSGFDYAQSIQQTTDGGYIVAGRTSSNNGDVTENQGFYDFWIVKFEFADCPELSANIGDSCDDNNENTVNDVVTEDCQCVGTLLDSDNDGVTDNVDNCSETSNPNQEDMDNDGIGDACDEDIDGDGVANADDCDPYDAEVTTGATWFADADSDGFGDAAVSVTSCAQPAGYVADNTDCDDSNPSVYPGTTEIPNDGIDQNCDGEDLVEVCPAPTGIEVNVVSRTNVIFNDVNGETGDLYDIESSANPGFAPTGTPNWSDVAMPFRVPFALANNWTYEFYARKDCGALTSDWAGPFRFTVTPGTEVVLSPNPAMDKVRVSGMKVKEMRIFDKYGRMVISTAMQSNEFDVSKLQSGIYTVELTGHDGQVSVQQLIKK